MTVCRIHVRRCRQASRHRTSLFPPWTETIVFRWPTIVAEAPCSSPCSSGCGARSAVDRSRRWVRPRTKLKALGVETLGIVATTPGERPALLQVPPDPPASGCRSRAHDASRVWLAEAGPDPGVHEDAGVCARINPTGEFPEPLPIPEAAAAISKLDGYTENQTDKAEMERQWPQLKGQFLIDRDGIVRWANIECATEGFAGVGKFPSTEDILAAVRALPR